MGQVVAPWGQCDKMAQAGRGRRLLSLRSPFVEMRLLDLFCTLQIVERFEEHDSNARQFFWAEIVPHFSKNLQNSQWLKKANSAHVCSSPRWHLVAMACLGLAFPALAIQRSGQVHLLPGRRPARFVAQSKFAQHRRNSVGELPVHPASALLELGCRKTLLIGLASTLAQFYWKPTRKLKLIQLLFNVSQVTVSSAAAFGAYQFVAI